MPVPPISITAFGGEVPAVDQRLIGDNNASASVNAWLFSGRIEPIRSLQPLHVLENQDARSFFRKPLGNADIDHMSAHLDDVTESGKGEVADNLRPFYLDYLRSHGVKAPS